MKNGTAAGAVAGVFSGIVAVIVTYLLATAMAVSLAPGVSVAEWLTEQIGYHIIWGATIGLLYARFYDLIWGKGISKGVVWDMIIFWFADVLAAAWLVGPNRLMAFGVFWIIIAFVARLAHGIALGALYKK